MMDASRAPLSQPIAWDPLDLSDDAVPAITKGANDAGLGILPDVTTRPELEPVPRPDAPDAPWE